MERETVIEDLRTFETKAGNTRYVARDADGNEYTTFREEIGDAARRAKGARVRLAYHEQQRGQYTNVYLDAVEPIGAPGAAGDDTDPEEAGWRTAVDAAPWLVGAAQAKEEEDPDQLFEKLKPFKDRVAEDIRTDHDEDDED